MVNTHLGADVSSFGLRVHNKIGQQECGSSMVPPPTNLLLIHTFQLRKARVGMAFVFKDHVFAFLSSDLVFQVCYAHIFIFITVEDPDHRLSLSAYVGYFACGSPSPSIRFL